MISTIIGIDPGLKGGIAVITERSVQVYAMDDQRILEVAHDHAGDADTIVVLEKTHAMPRQGVVSQWSFGVQHGWLMGIFAAMEIKVCLVTPQSWKRYHDLIGEDKQASIDLAHNLYPTVSLRRNSRCRTDSDGMAEALLIADYGWRTLAGRERPVC